MTGSAIQHTGRTNYNQVYRKVIKLPWHKWFAWYPARVSGTEIVWLAGVWRRKNWDGPSYWEYKMSLDSVASEPPTHQNHAELAMSLYCENYKNTVFAAFQREES